MTSCNEILEYYATREDGIKYGPKIIYFCMDLVTHFMNLYARTEDESEAYKSFGLELNSLVVDKIFYLICKVKFRKFSSQYIADSDIFRSIWYTQAM